MKKINLLESVQPCSGSYSVRQDLRLNAWFAVAAANYLGVLLLLSRHHEWSPLTRGLLMLTPMIPGMLYVRTCMRFVRGMDELQRRIQLEAWLFASLGSLIVVTVINTLNINGVALGNLGKGVSLGATFTLAFALWIVGTALATRRYK